MIEKLLTGFLAGSMVFSLSALDIVTDGIARIELESGTALPEKTAVNEFKRIIKAVTGSEIGNGKAPNKLVIGTPETNPAIAKEAVFLGLIKNRIQMFLHSRQKGISSMPPETIHALQCSPCSSSWNSSDADGSGPAKTGNIFLRRQKICLSAISISTAGRRLHTGT
ncbi:MAG: hypothetical protein V8T87_11145 [Victivallales bacterium]